MSFWSDPSFFVFISATKTLETQAVQVLQEMSVFFFLLVFLFCFFSKRTAVLGLLMHPGNCKHSPLDYLLGDCYVPVTIASGHKAGIQQPCSEKYSPAASQLLRRLLPKSLGVCVVLALLFLQGN